MHAVYYDGDLYSYLCLAGPGFLPVGRKKGSGGGKEREGVRGGGKRKGRGEGGRGERDN